MSQKAKFKPIASPEQLTGVGHTARRRAIDKGSRGRKSQYLRIYRKANGICHWCDKPVNLFEGSRDHLMELVKVMSGIISIEEYREDSNVVLAHKECNKNEDDPTWTIQRKSKKKIKNLSVIFLEPNFDVR